MQAKQKGGNRQLMASGTVSLENAREANHFAKEITATDLCDHAFHQPFRANHPAASSFDSPLITRGNIVSVTAHGLTAHGLTGHGLTGHGLIGLTGHGLTGLFLTGIFVTGHCLMGLCS